MLSELSRANFDAILPKVQTYSTVCDSSLGRIGSLLLGSVAERCQQVSQAVRLIEVGCPHFELIVPGILTRQEFTVGLC